MQIIFFIVVMTIFIFHRARSSRHLKALMLGTSRATPILTAVGLRYG